MRSRPDQIINGFDSVLYLLAYPDVAASGIDPLTHFNTIGWKEGRFPNGLFDTAYYLFQFPDIAAANVNLFQHYLASGWKEGRDPSPFFDTSVYLAANPDVAAAGENPLLHFLGTGIFEGRTISGSPSPTNRSDFLIGTAGSDTINAGDGNDIIVALKGDDTVNGEAGTDTARFSGKFADYVITFDGDQVIAAGPEGSDRFSNIERFAFHDVTFDRTIAGTNPLIDDFYYYASNKDVWAAGVDPGAHFAASGWKEGRDPNPIFDTSYYLQNNPDVAAAGVNPLEHFLAFGFKEARDPSAAFDTSADLANNPDVAAAGINPLLHYLAFGKAEGRSPTGSVQTSVAMLEDSDLVFSLNDFDFGKLASVTSITFDASDVANGTLFLDADGNGSIEGGEALSGSGHVVSAADIVAGKLIFRPAHNANGNAYASFGYKGSDGSSESAQGRMAVNVTPVNDAPGFVLSTSITGTNEDAGAQTVANFLTSISTGPADESGQSISFVVNASNPSLFSAAPTIDANGTLRYTAAANASGMATVTVFAQDNGGGANGGNDASPPQVFTIEILAANDAPTVTTTGGSTAYIEEQAAVVVDSSIVVGDSDSASLSGARAIISGNWNSDDILSFTPIGNITGSYNPLSGVLTLTGVDTVANYQLALRSVTFANPVTGDIDAAPRSIDFDVTDTDLTTSSLGSRQVDVVQVNDAPTLAATADDPPYAGVAVDLFDSPTIATVESGQTLIKLVITVSAVTGTDESLSIDGSTVSLTDGFGVTTAGNGLTALVAIDVNGLATVTLVHTPGISPADLQGIIDGITYAKTTPAGNESPRTITITELQDSGGTGNGGDDTSSPNLASTVSFNQPPTISVDGAIAYTENDSATVIDASITVTDPNAGDTIEGAVARITTGFAAGEDELAFDTALATGFGITGSFVGDTLTLSGSATAAQYEQVLETVTYRNNSQYPTDGTRTISLVVNDGSLDSLPGTATVTVASVNDAPVNLMPAEVQTVLAGGTLAFSQSNGNRISISDLDALSGNETVTLSVGSGTLTLGVTANVVVAGNGTGTLQVTGSTADIADVLDSLRYNAGSAGIHTLTVAVDDNGNSGTGGSRQDTDAIQIVVMNPTGGGGPQIDLDLNDNHPGVEATGYGTTFVEGTSPVPVVDTDIAITGSPESATVTLVNRKLGDVLRVNGQATSGILDYNSGDDVIGFTINTSASDKITITFISILGIPSPSDYQDALTKISFSNARTDLDTTDRVLTFVLNDGASDSNTAVSTIEITAVSNLHAANGEENSGAAVTGDLSVAELGAVFDAAVARWQAVGLSQSQLAELDRLDVAIADLAGSSLGEYSQGRIKIDINGAGHGWFVDATPLDDIEFAPVLSAGGLRAIAGGDVASQFDLLTVVMHEIGHALGFDHVEDENGLMSSELGVGERWLLS